MRSGERRIDRGILLIGDGKAKLTRAEARKRYQDAKKRGDTREMHSAWKDLRAATNRELMGGM